MVEASDVVILGAGFTGLSAAWQLGDRAITIEREARPGGIVRTERVGDCWIDHVVHLLYFQDPETEQRIRGLLGDTLVPCPPRAWVDTGRGVARFPLQLHLGDLDAETCIRCCREIAWLTCAPTAAGPANFEERLLGSFGATLCERFLLPYNRKMWKRPLHELAPSGFTWNIARPDLDRVLRGAITPEWESGSYNAAGWYPRPPSGAPVRGMEVVTTALAEKAADLRVGHTVHEVDLQRRQVTLARRRAGGRVSMSKLAYRDRLLSTIPLPSLMALCVQAPDDLRTACADLQRNRVLSVALAIEGDRPKAPGHWRYYGDESLVFTRLIFMHEFDPLCAPPDGWGLLAEVTGRAEDPLPSEDALVRRVVADAKRAGVIEDRHAIVGQRVITIDPAYVVFRPGTEAVVERARTFLASYGVASLGRYGGWEYSSMSSCLQAGFDWARALDPPGARAVERSEDRPVAC